MKNQTFVCGTLFHLYISTLKSINYHKTGVKTLLIITDFTLGIDEIAKSLIQRNIFDNLLIVHTIRIKTELFKKDTLFKRIRHRNCLTIKAVEENSNIVDFYPFINDSEINLFSSKGFSNTFFILKFKKNYIRLIEDGYRNYNPRIGRIKAFKRKYILRTVIGEGRDKEVKNIEVQFPDNLPKYVMHKGTKLDFTGLQEKLSEKETNTILSIFLKNHTINIGSGKNLILITQPLSEDRLISEKAKIQLYKDILVKYKNDYIVYIKTHPRELTDYKAQLNIDFVEIPRSFPLELLNFLNHINFNLGITIFSSALNNLICVENRIFIGEDVLKLYKNI